MEKYVVKPIFSREGANVRSLRTAKPLKQRKVRMAKKGDCSAIPPVTEIRRQLYADWCWLVNDQPAGIGIREDRALIPRICLGFIHIFLLNNQ